MFSSRPLLSMFSWNAPFPEFHNPRLPNGSPVIYACVCLAMDICTMFSWYPHNTSCVQDFWHPSVSSSAQTAQPFHHSFLYTNIWSVWALCSGMYHHDSVFITRLVIGCLFSCLHVAVFYNIAFTLKRTVMYLRLSLEDCFWCQFGPIRLC